MLFDWEDEKIAREADKLSVGEVKTLTGGVGTDSGKEVEETGASEGESVF